MGTVQIDGSTPKITVGNATAEDALILFDGNAQDFHIGLDDTADDLVIGVGSALGTTTALAIDENAGSTFSGTVTVGVDDTGKDVKFFGATASRYWLWDESADGVVQRGTLTVGVDDTGHDVKLFGATASSYMLWDESADDLNLIASGIGVGTAKDLGVGIHVRTADSGASANAGADELVIENNGVAGLSILTSTSTAGTVAFGDSGDDNIGYIQYDHNNDTMQIGVNASTMLLLASAGGKQITSESAWIFNEAGADLDFRIESSGNANMLCVDGGNDRVGIGTNAPLSACLLDIRDDGSPAIKLSDTSSHYIRIGKGYAAGSDETFFIDSNGAYTFIMDVNGKISTGGEAAPDVDAGGITLDQNAADGHIFTLKSSDIAHGMTSLAETDTYFGIKKYSATAGGVRIECYGEAALGAVIDGRVTSGDSDTSTSSLGGVLLKNSKKDSTTVGAHGVDDNMVVVTNADAAKFLVKGDGDIYYDGADQGAYDSYDDAHMVRALDLSRNVNTIDSKFDKFIAYNHEHLAELQLVGREKDGTPNHFISITGLQRLHNGAIWQQYSKHQQLLEAVYDLAKEAVGEEKANSILDKHEVKRLQ